MSKSTTLMNSATLLTGYWMSFTIAVSCGIGDFPYLSVLHGTGVNRGFLLLVNIEVFSLDKGLVTSRDYEFLTDKV